jgi:hypothetical protein
MVGLTEDIASIKEYIKSQEADKVEKKFKFPFGKKVGRGQKTKNYCTILVINENGNYNFKKYKIEDQTILHDAIPRLATAGHVIFDKKGNPLIILPSWSVEPFSPLEHYEKSLINGSNVTGYKILMAKMLSSKVDEKKKIGSWIYWVVGIGLATLIGYALITGGGK